MDPNKDQPVETGRSVSIDSDSRTSNPVRADLGVWAAFAVLVVLVAINVIAIRFSNRELPPFWGAGIRFFAAAMLFLIYAFVRRLPFPRGRALAGVLIFGLLQFGVGFALAYWALQKVPAGLGSVILASIPLFTLVFAFFMHLEPFRFRGLAGSLAAVAGIAVLVGERAGNDIPVGYLLAAVATAMVFALSAIVAKSFPQVHLAMMNGIGMLTGAVMLFVLAFVNQEMIIIPSQPATWAAFVYLVVPGSVGVFGLLLFVLKRWPATTVSYQTVLSPIISIALSAWLLDEPLTSGLYLGSIMVIAGVYIGVLAPDRGIKPVSP